MSSFEQQRFVDAFHALQNNGKLDALIGAHADTDAFRQAHSTSAFLPWHRYYIWELETQIRELPGYECFTLPFWDWSRVGLQAETASIWNTQIGGNGDENDGWCVTDGGFQDSLFQSNANCLFNDGPTCCLRRIFSVESERLRSFPDPSELANDMISNPNYIGASSIHGYRFVFCAFQKIYCTIFFF